VIRVYLPPEANCLLSVSDQCLRVINVVNLMKLQPRSEHVGAFGRGL
jgi:phosphoketolase